MEIQYLKQFSKITEIGGWKTEGLSLNEIVALETKHNNGNPFPKAYREYLYIGGRSHGLELDEAFGFDWLQETSKAILEEYNQTIDRPFFVIDQLDGCEQFGFFYLDNEDEDPIIYNCLPPYVEDGEELIQIYKQRQFSKVIEALIESALAWDASKNIPYEGD